SLPRGVTLIELLVVLMILSLILTAAVKTWDVTLQRTRFEQTRQKLDALAKAIVGDPDNIVEGRRVDFGYVGDMGSLPRTLADLAVPPPVSPPESSRWRGPYLKGLFSQAPDAYRIDGWGDSIVYNKDSMFVRSYGGVGLMDPTKWITRSFGWTEREVLRDSVFGRVLDIRGMAPPDSLRPRISVKLEYPRAGKAYRDSVGVGPQGEFWFRDIPQGNHLLTVSYWSSIMPPVCDTVLKYITVYPRIGAKDIEVRMGVDWSSP
ncbi:MAG: type II secretion system protein, partial [candidate division WOR-3 bacterium]